LRIARFDEGNFSDSSIAPLLAAAHQGTDPAAVQRLDRLIKTIAQKRLQSAR